MATFPILDIKNYWRNLSDSIATVGGALMGKSMQISGSDGSNSRIIKTNNSGEVLTQLSGSNAPLSGQKSVTSAGTAEALGGDQEYKNITIIAKSTNTGNIYIGGSTVDSSTGGIMPAGGYVTLDFVNTNEVYIDADANGEGVTWIGVV